MISDATTGAIIRTIYENTIASSAIQNNRVPVGVSMDSSNKVYVVST